MERKNKGESLMYCINCGAKIEEGDIFCSNCGELVEREQDTAVLAEENEYRDGMNDFSEELYYMNSPVMHTSAAQAEQKNKDHRSRRSSRKLKKRNLVFLFAMVIAAAAAFVGAVVISLKPANSNKADQSVINNDSGISENQKNETSTITIEHNSDENENSLPDNEIPAAESFTESNTTEQMAPKAATSTYEVVIGDYSWTAASLECTSKGGHLVTLDSPEEFNTVIAMLDNNEYWAGKVFFVGAKRDLSDNLYYWIDGYNQPYGTPLNDSSSWIYPYWPAGEPSFSDQGVQENVCSIFKYQGSWIINDEPDDILTTVPEYSGIIGYICEYENSSGSANTSVGENSPVSANSSESEQEQQVSKYDYALLYEGAFVDVESKIDFSDDSVQSSGLMYTIFDMDGDGIKELMFYKRGGRQYNVLWIYSTDGSSYKYRGKIESAAINTDSIYGYDNGFILAGTLNMGGQFEFAASHYKWNGETYEDIVLMQNSYSSVSDIPTIEQLGELGYYDLFLITEKAPEFRDVSDKSLLVGPTVDVTNSKTIELKDYYFGNINTAAEEISGLTKSVIESQDPSMQGYYRIVYENNEDGLRLMGVDRNINEAELAGIWINSGTRYSLFGISIGMSKANVLNILNSYSMIINMYDSYLTADTDYYKDQGNAHSMLVIYFENDLVTEISMSEFTNN